MPHGEDVSSLPRRLRELEVQFLAHIAADRERWERQHERHQRVDKNLERLFSTVRKLERWQIAITAIAAALGGLGGNLLPRLFGV